MSLYKEFTVQLNEMNIADLVKNIQHGGGCCGSCSQHGPDYTCDKCAKQGPIQADNNIGEFGSAPKVQPVQISRAEDGNVKITTDTICVKLNDSIVKCLMKFLEMEGNVNG